MVILERFAVTIAAASHRPGEATLAVGGLGPKVSPSANAYPLASCTNPRRNNRLWHMDRIRDIGKLEAERPAAVGLRQVFAPTWAVIGTRFKSRRRKMSHQQVYEASGCDYTNESFRTVERIRSSKQNRPTMGRRRGKAPESFNGIHRRRRRKLAW